MTELYNDRLYKTLHAYIRVLQIFFKNWPEYQWSENPAETKIIITKAYPHNPDTTNKLPLVVVNLMQAAWQGTSPHSFMYENPFDYYRPKKFADIIHSGAEIMCIAANDVVVRNIAWAIFLAIPILAKYIERFGGADYIDQRLNMSPAFDASQFLGATPGTWWGIRIISPFRIGQEILVPAESSIVKTIKDITLELEDKTSK